MKKKSAPKEIITKNILYDVSCSRMLPLLLVWTKFIKILIDCFEFDGMEISIDFELTNWQSS